SLLGKVKVCTNNDSCRHTRIAAYNDIDLQLGLNTWHMGVMAEDEEERSLHFFDKGGREVHAIYLVQGESNNETFEAIKRNFGLTLKSIPPFRLSESLPVESSEPQLNDFEKGVNVQRMQWRDADFVRKILHASADQKLSIKVIVPNSGCIQVHTGRITNLIDQGERYMIKDTSFILEIRWDRIKDIWTVC